MTVIVLSDWFLDEWNSYINQIKALSALIKWWCLLWEQLRHSLARLASIELWRLVVLVGKRIISITKSVLRDFFITLPNPLLEFLYVLHFFRAFLTLISYFSEPGNKNLVEIGKFLLACCKIFLALLMLTFITIAIVHGAAPLMLATYGSIKTYFLIYTGIKFIISCATLGFSYYKGKIVKYSGGDSEHAWLIAQYNNNSRKHVLILTIGMSTMICLSLLSFVGFAGLGQIGFVAVISLACIFLLADIIKSIYFFYAGTTVPEPQIADLKQQNSFIDYSFKDYYYRKCRVARLEQDELLARPTQAELLLKNKIYLLKEIIVKLTQFKIILEKDSYLKIGHFFSEKQKIQEKINTLIQEAAALLDNDREKNISLFEGLLTSFRADREKLEYNNNKTVLTVERIDSELASLAAQLEVMKGERSLVKKATPANQENNTDKKEWLWEILCAKDSLDQNTRFDEKLKMNYHRRFFQSFFRKVGDCEDIHRARCAVTEQDSASIA